MHVDLDLEEIEVLIESVAYSIRSVSAELHTATKVKRETLERLESARDKLKYAKKYEQG